MNQKIKIGNSGIITLTDKHYKAAGGEASIYVANGMAYKLYHEPDKKQLSPKKMQELTAIPNPQVVIPKELIFDPKDGKPLGYTTRFIDNVEPLLKLFTRTFKTDNNISQQMINHLIKEMQLVVADVHKAKCLIVDLNELNILAEIKPTNIIPWFIDTDSYATPSFKATAVMDSIRDRKASVIDKNGTLHYNPTIESDWFSFAILAFWLYSNIHAYRGTHPNYKPKDKQKQMDDGVSVFHPGVRVPPCVNDFKLIPARHLDWFKRVFLNNERDIPPLPDSSVPLLVPTQVITIQGTDKLGVDEISAYAGPIITIQAMMGIYYVATKTNYYANKKEIGTHNAKKVNICFSSDGTIVVAEQDNSNKINFRDLTKANPIGSAVSEAMFTRNNAIYTLAYGKLIENTFISLGANIIHKATELENISVTSAKMYDGCVIQDLLGKQFLALPYKQGCCFSKHIPQLDGYRIIDAKADKNVVIIIGEKKGKYDRFILIYSKGYSVCDIRKVEDIAYDGINFTVMHNGLCILLASPTELELFVNATQCETLQNPPFDSNMKLFSTSDGIFFINGNSFHQLKRK